jgi:hypothetical protein
MVNDHNSTASMYIIQLHPVVHFLWVKGNLAKDIHKDMFPVYNVNCLLHKAVNWVGKSTEGHPKLEDLSGQIQ